MHGRFWSRLTALSLVAVALRLLPWLIGLQSPGLLMDPDSYGYHELAVNWLDGQGYMWITAEGAVPNAYRPPGLPAVLIALYSLVGVWIPAAILLQIFVAGLTVMLLGWLARTLMDSQRTGLIAAGLLAVDPVSIYYTSFLLTEAYSALFLTLALLLSCAFYRSGQSRWLLALAGLLGLAILVHPLLVFAPLLLLGLPWFSTRTRTLRMALAGVAATCLALVPPGLWVVRNWLVADYAGLSSVASVNLLKYKAAGVEAVLRGTSREVERDRLTAAVDARLPEGISRGQRWRSWEQAAWSILAAHPWIYARLHVQGVLLELIGPERDLFYRFAYGPRAVGGDGRVSDASIRAALREPLPLPLEGLRFLVLFAQGSLLLLELIGLVSVLKQRHWKVLALFVPIVCVLLLTGGPESSPRFRVVYMPLLAVFAAAGWQTVAGWRRALQGARQPVVAVAPGFE